MKKKSIGLYRELLWSKSIAQCVKGANTAFPCTDTHMFIGGYLSPLLCLGQNITMYAISGYHITNTEKARACSKEDLG